MEEVFLRVLACDEAEAPIGYDLLDGTGGHMDLQLPEHGWQDARPVREGGSTTRSVAASGCESGIVARLFERYPAACPGARRMARRTMGRVVREPGVVRRAAILKPAFSNIDSVPR